jgi:hypothetical protein
MDELKRREWKMIHGFDCWLMGKGTFQPPGRSIPALLGHNGAHLS